MAAILALNPGAVCRVVTSARNVERCFRDLRTAETSLNPIERLVFSLVLANTKSRPAETPVDASQMPRT